MTAERTGPYAVPMSSRSVEEQAALVALLQARPDGMSWPEITAEVLEAGSAVEVWDRLVPAALIPDPANVSPVTAAGEIRRWAGRGGLPACFHS